MMPFKNFKFSVIAPLVILLMSTGLLSAQSIAGERKNPLPTDQAFAFSVSIQNPKELHANWRIAPGYHLYRQDLHITLVPEQPADIQYPQGELKEDATRGKVEMYAGNLSIPILLQHEAQTIQLKVAYQGCADGKFCYPPIHKNVTLDLKMGTTATPFNPTNSSSWQSLLTNQNGIHALFATQHYSLIILFFICLGLLLSFTPCVLPMIPILTVIIVGQKQKISTKKAFALSLSYVLGTSITYAIAGLFVALMGNSLQRVLQQPLVISLVSGLFVLLAFSLFGFYEFRLPPHWQNRITHLLSRQRGGNYASVFLMGMVSTLIVSPCVTAPLVGILMYIAQTGNIALGASALFALGIGMGIPLLVIGTSAGKLLPKSGPWMEALKKTFGLLMLAMAIWLVSRFLSNEVTNLLWSFLLFGVALFFITHLPRHIGWHKVNRCLGFAAGLYGLFLINAVVTPKILDHLTITTPTASSFIVVHDVAQLNKQLALAQAAHKPVILDFYANWCESCISMDQHVFKKPDIQNRLSNFVLLRADLSANNSADETLLKQSDVIAPPTVLFFDTNGQELNSHRIIGEVNAKEFLTRLHTFIAAACDKKTSC